LLAALVVQKPALEHNVNRAFTSVMRGTLKLPVFKNCVCALDKKNTKLRDAFRSELATETVIDDLLLPN
jgi:hypothetical protein